LSEYVGFPNKLTIFSRGKYVLGKHIARHGTGLRTASWSERTHSIYRTHSTHQTGIEARRRVSASVILVGCGNRLYVVGKREHTAQREHILRTERILHTEHILSTMRGLGHNGGHLLDLV